MCVYYIMNTYHCKIGQYTSDQLSSDAVWCILYFYIDELWHSRPESKKAQAVEHCDVGKKEP